MHEQWIPGVLLPNYRAPGNEATQISTVYEALWLHYIMQQNCAGDPPLPSAFPLLHFWEGEEGLAARLIVPGMVEEEVEF